MAPSLLGEVSIWNVDDGQKRVDLSKRYTVPIDHVRFSPDGRFVMVSPVGGPNDLFDATTGSRIANYQGSAKSIFNPHGRFFIEEVWGRQTRFQIVSIDQLRTSRHDLQLPRVRESVLAVAPDGRTFATSRPVSQYSELCLWNRAVGQPMMVLGQNDMENMLTAAFSADGTILAVLGTYLGRERIILWRANPGDSAALTPGPEPAG